MSFRGCLSGGGDIFSKSVEKQGGANRTFATGGRCHGWQLEPCPYGLEPLGGFYLTSKEVSIKLVSRQSDGNTKEETELISAGLYAIRGYFVPVGEVEIRMLDHGIWTYAEQRQWRDLENMGITFHM